MKKKLYFLEILCFAISVFMFVACSSINDEENFKFPQTDAEIETSVKMTNAIAKASCKIANAEINKAVTENRDINSDEIARQIAQIDSVVEAKPNQTGTAIQIKQTDGIYINLLLATADDDRIFISENTPKNISAASVLTNFQDKSINASDKESRSTIYNKDIAMPNGKKALILAAFEGLLINKPIATYSSYLTSAGYSVDIYKNNNVGLDKFNGSYLTDYDFILISTHGSSMLKLLNGKTGDVLATSHHWSIETAKALRDEMTGPSKGGNVALVTVPLQNDIYLGVSAQYIRETAGSKRFNNSLIIASACEGLKNTNGVSSLSQTFLDLGAIGYSGYTETINHFIGNKCTLAIINYLCYGYNLEKTIYKVKNDDYLKAYDYGLRFAFLRSDPKYSQLAILSYRQKSKNTFLVNPIPFDLTSSVDKGTVTLSWKSNLKGNLLGDPAISSINEPVYFDIYI